MENKPICITDQTKCCGCRACANICPRHAIRFEMDECGFFYPVVDHERCVSCGLCEKVCDFSKEKGIERALPIKAYAAALTDREKLKKSSSGGVFMALAEYVLSINGAVCGCVLDEELQPMHICAEQMDGVVRMRGSKYAQSDVGMVYREIKERIRMGQFVLFTGTPCQVAGLYAVLGSRKPESLLTVDLVCHGVPSAMMFKKYIEYLEKKHHTKIAHFNFRSKKYGWQRWTTEFTDTNGRVKNIGKVNEFYITAFTTGNMMRPGCFSCKYASQERVGDITVGDLWGQEKHGLSFPPDDGISLCTFNTENAFKVMDAMTERMRMQEIRYDVAAQNNRCLHEPTAKGSKWAYYMKALKEERIADAARAYIRSHRKTILRSQLRLHVPQAIFNFVRKIKYGGSK